MTQPHLRLLSPASEVGHRGFLAQLALVHSLIDEAVRLTEQVEQANARTEARLRRGGLGLI